MKYQSQHFASPRLDVSMRCPSRTGVAAWIPHTKQGWHLSALLQQVLSVQVGLSKTPIFKCKKEYHPWFKSYRLYTVFLPFQYTLPRYHTILTALQVCTSKTHPHPLHPLLSSALCNYNQICKPQKVDSPPCILITVASPLEQTGLQDAEFTDNLFWN